MHMNEKMTYVCPECRQTELSSEGSILTASGLEPQFNGFNDKEW